MMHRNKALRTPLAARLSACLFFGAAVFGAFLLSQELYAQNLASAQKEALSRDGTLPKNKSASYYTAIANLALDPAKRDYALAEQASVELLRINHNDIAAWNRLAFVDRRQNGHLTRDGIAALYKSFELSPYGNLDMMIWRVEFASANWSSLTTELQKKVIAQIPIIGHFGTSWQWRIHHCKTNPHKALYEAICEIAPGVNRPA